MSKGTNRSLTQWEAYERSVAGTSDDFLYSCQNLHICPLYKNSVSQYIADEWGVNVYRSPSWRYARSRRLLLRL